ncbi:MAG: mitochondrial pyruvate dehydrogenase [Piptocephalis tieghemiana]|nr:MAG: mitochondrial pyruvate dehydrogenase [Piptocephalis tieghemiana]
MSLLKIPPSLYDKIKHFATFPQTGVSLRQMVKFGQNPSPGTLFRASQFMLDELPIRLAHRVVELDSLPNGLSDMPSIQKVKLWYAQSFHDLVELPPIQIPKEIRGKMQSRTTEIQLPPNNTNPSIQSSSLTRSPRHSIPINHRFYTNLDDVSLPSTVQEGNERLVRAITAIKTRHDAVVTTMAQGIQEYKEARQTPQIDGQVQGFLDRFYMSRIGIRMLIGQHIALHQGNMLPDHVGIICTRTKVLDLVQEAVDNSRFICEDHYGLFSAPEVQVYCDEGLEFMYVPSHLHHMLFELLKNSLRAIVEREGADEDTFPPIKLVVAQGQEDITIKISDEGGGIPRSALPMVWTYMYTTAGKPSLDPNFAGPDFKAPMAGFGYGLPLSRLYARYFGGDLRLISMEGYGTDAYLHLSRLSDSEEPLP